MKDTSLIATILLHISKLNPLKLAKPKKEILFNKRRKLIILFLSFVEKTVIPEDLPLNKELRTSFNS